MQSRSVIILVAQKSEETNNCTLLTYYIFII